MVTTGSNDETISSVNLCHIGDMHLKNYDETNAVGHLYLAIGPYKQAAKCGDMMGIEGLNKIKEEMLKIKIDPMIGGPNINYLDTVINEVKELDKVK